MRNQQYIYLTELPTGNAVRMYVLSLPTDTSRGSYQLVWRSAHSRPTMPGHGTKSGQKS
jgi:hypothetical protein